MSNYFALAQKSKYGNLLWVGFGQENNYYKKMKTIIIIFLFAICSKAYSQPTIIGKWRRLDDTSKNRDKNNKQLRFGDMEIRSDSTFHIKGDSTTNTSTVSGWHVGDELNGTWEKLDAQHFIFWVGHKNDKMFISYTIEKLNKNNLILSIGPARKKVHKIKFKRL